MTTSEIKSYIEVRHGELSSDEILHVIDIERNPQIDHIQYHDNRYEMWDNKGAYFTFTKRIWS